MTWIMWLTISTAYGVLGPFMGGIYESPEACEEDVPRVIRVLAASHPGVVLSRCSPR